MPDIPTWAVRDYGNRVGVFRFMDVFDKYGIRATVALNSDICIHHPMIIAEGNKRQWEWMGHNKTNSKRLIDMTEDEEPKAIKEALDTIARVAGKRPKGWLGSGLQETWNTLDHPCRRGRRLCLRLGERRSALSDDVGERQKDLRHSL